MYFLTIVLVITVHFKSHQAVINVEVQISSISKDSLIVACKG